MASGQLDQTIYTTLLETAWLRQKRAVRLIGVGIRLADDDDSGQAILL